MSSKKDVLYLYSCLPKKNKQFASQKNEVLLFLSHLDRTLEQKQLSMIE